MTEDQKKLIEDAKDQIYRVLVVLNPEVEPDIYDGIYERTPKIEYVISSVSYQQPIIIHFNTKYKEFYADQSDVDDFQGRGKTAIEAVKNYLDDKYASLYNEYTQTEIHLKRIGDLIDDLESMGDGI